MAALGIETRMSKAVEETSPVIAKVKERYVENLKRLNDTVLTNRFVPVTPTPRQAEFLTNPHGEVLYGGGAAGGKSIALLIAALMYVEQADYNAIIFRKSFTDLALPGAIMEVSKEWLLKTPAHWDQIGKVWKFPSGATLSFGYLDTADAMYRYQSAEFHFLAIDEVTQIPERSYTYMFSRRRQTRDSNIPLRYYTATNPPQTDEGFWVYHRFIEGARPRHFTDPETKKKYIHFFEKEDEDGIRAYVPALLTDNPYVNESYHDSLKRLDHVTRRQLEFGDWFIKPSGGIFEKEWFDRTYDPSDPPNFDDTIISADIAMKDKETSDYSCFQAWGRKDANYYLIDSIRGKWQYPEMKRKFLMFCERNDGVMRKLVEDKSAGTSLLQDLKDEIPGLVPFQPGTKSKSERAKLVSPLFEAGNVYLPTHRAFTRDLINELVSFDGFGRKHDDQCDAMSQALLKLKKKPGRFFVGSI